MNSGFEKDEDSCEEDERNFFFS